MSKSTKRRRSVLRQTWLTPDEDAIIRRKAAAAGVTLSDFAFSDADEDSGNDWSVTQAATTLRWQAPEGHTLDWGTLYRFSFTADRAPLPASDCQNPGNRYTRVKASFPSRRALTATAPIGTKKNSAKTAAAGAASAIVVRRRITLLSVSGR